ncbi:glycoside hydrolase family 57 protein [Pelobacter propionicus]|uniref:Glycoside hydrolase, family 57 n=1 Tax=Pelobacter propionicus (strain DSM 2379 / NBRC 103807 / OttBd1) TaxID=338966 RepID=A1AJZ7_PELPD|nr:glycoside hydrolase family 57 protein [Pelobacter propionicus]ABK97667.1 glycoside hydrolase, family 57 [Pelobacter propionicus DSM 2379]
MPTPLDVVIVWHMHQPYYKDPIKNAYALPWTYLHAIKDYFDMPAIVEDTPGARAVFNLVPSLIEQVLDYADGTAVDRFLEMGRAAPADLCEDDRIFLLENFFSANRQRMIEPNRRYLELLYMAGEGKAGNARDRVRHFSDQDLLDLQVCFFLAWTGEAARRRYPAFGELIVKGDSYTNADKELLFTTQREVVRAIIPLYKRLHDAGAVELAVSPYYHPILPLLCDTRIALNALPRIAVPAAHFSYPEDARAQIRRGIDYFRSVFGFIPNGMWPPEGSVSSEALEIIAECGLSWIASDEEVLAKSLERGLGDHKERLYRPWRFDGSHGGLGMFFRDHHLSDLIGFTYSSWDAGRAADDLCCRLTAIKERIGGEGRVIPIILDGENAWEYYANNGYDFLRSMYTAISGTPELNLTTCSDVLTNTSFTGRLHTVHPGSWINANFGIWIGHPEENLAWELLARTRETAASSNPDVAAILDGHQADGDGSRIAEQICCSLYAAEGSDWFWWYGDDHFSPHSDRFDRLFRQHLLNVYHLLGLDPPSQLLEPIKKKSPAGLIREPATFIDPNINGRISDYFEWLAAGLYDLTRQGSAMHSSDRMLQSFYYGYNRTSFFVRIDGIQELSRLLREVDVLNLHLIFDREYRLPMQISCDEGLLLVKESNLWVPTHGHCHWKVAKTCEVSIPLEVLRLPPRSKLFASLSLVRDNEEIGRWPSDAPLMLYYAGPEIELENWLI